MERKATGLRAAAALIAFTGLILAHSAQASDPDKVKLIRRLGGSSYFMVGANFLLLQNLSKSLVDGGYEGVDGASLALGGGGHFILNRVILGGEGYSFEDFEDRIRRGGYMGSISGGYVLAKFGYMMVDFRGLRIFPLVGFGAGTLRVRTAQAAGDPLDDAANDPGQGIELSVTGFLLDLSIGIEYQFSVGKNAGSRFGPSLCLRGGFIGMPVGSRWKTTGGTLGHEPNAGITGPYIRLVVGFGGSRMF